MKCNVQTAISSHVGLHNGRNRSFPLALSGIGTTYLLNSVNFLSDAREPKNSLCPRGKQASSTLCHRVLSSSSSSSWLEAWTGKSFFAFCSLHVLCRVWLLYLWSLETSLKKPHCQGFVSWRGILKYLGLYSQMKCILLESWNLDCCVKCKPDLKQSLPEGQKI